MPDAAAWKRVGELLVARRVQLGYPRRAAFLRSKNAAKFERIAGDLEAGHRDNYEPGTLAYAENLYEWRPGSISEVLDGGEPMISSLDVQRKISRHLDRGVGAEDVTVETEGRERHQAEPVGGADEDDPVLFLLTQEEQRRLDRLPAAERRRVLEAMKASARGTADALLRTGDDE